MQVDGIKILEGLAASGLRSIRYALEVEGTGRVDANDLDSDAVEAMKRNIQYNGAAAEQRMRPLQGDARVIMLQSPLVSIETLRHVREGGRAGGGGIAVVSYVLLQCFIIVEMSFNVLVEVSCCVQPLTAVWHLPSPPATATPCLVSPLLPCPITADRACRCLAACACTVE